MDPTKLIVLGLAGYFGYLYYTGALSAGDGAGAGAGDGAGGGTGNTTGNGAGNGTGAGATASTRAALKALMAAEAARLGVPVPTGADDWNFVYQQVRGVAGPDVLAMWPGRDRGFKMTLDEYLDTAMQHGVAGLNYRRGRV